MSDATLSHRFQTTSQLPRHYRLRAKKMNVVCRVPPLSNMKGYSLRHAAFLSRRQQRIPCLFEMGEHPSVRKRSDAMDLIELLRERKLVVTEGEGGSRKTAADPACDRSTSSRRVYDALPVMGQTPKFLANLNFKPSQVCSF